MTANSQYTDSESDFKIDNWTPLGKAARRYLEKSVSAMNEGNSEVAEAYHAKAIELEAGPIGGAP